MLRPGIFDQCRIHRLLLLSAQLTPPSSLLPRPSLIQRSSYAENKVRVQLVTLVECHVLGAFYSSAVVLELDTIVNLLRTFEWQSVFHLCVCKVPPKHVELLSHLNF